ncbi:MAG TPA: SPFH domain-containing protein [Candidatus Dependentiae bacterium]|nr:SPFH domain-containing protein [Candidatus Dependentiae bacterium]HRQ62808.1 SPFH domain-containing protein [Candidatus Dependentiae bacterium]
MVGFPIGFAIFFLVVFLFLIVLLIKSVYLVKQAEVILIERLGKYHRMLKPGLHIVVPFLDNPRQVMWTFIQEADRGRYFRFNRTITRIDLREAVYDFPKQNVISKDNVTMEINALLYYQITDPKAAVYEINNLPQAIEKLTQTTLRDVIGSMDLDETLVSRGQINERLRIVLDEATDKWGVKVNRVELQEVNPPEDIRHAMEKQMRAERERREMILRSEGKKRSAILEAEGDQESRVLEAKGQAEARLTIAQAEAEAIQMIQRSVPHGDPLPYLIAMQYIKVLPELMKGKDDKIILVPYEASSMIGSLASMKKIFEQVK